MYATPSSNFSLLGLLPSYCKWINMGPPIGWRWVCRTGGGGGEKIIMPKGWSPYNVSGFGALGVAQQQNQELIDMAAAATTKPSDIGTPPITNGGFDIMQFLTDNWIWIAIAVAGVLIFPRILKKR